MIALSRVYLILVLKTLVLNCRKTGQRVGPGGEKNSRSAATKKLRGERLKSRTRKIHLSQWFSNCGQGPPWKPFQGVQRVKIIFIIIPRHYLPFFTLILWGARTEVFQKLWNMRYDNRLNAEADRGIQLSSIKADILKAFAKYEIMPLFL